MSPVATPIPLLLVADSAETCERIASALLSAPTFYRIERVTSAELNQKTPSSGIHLALVDQGLRAARQAQVVERLATAGVAAVALVDARDVQALQEVVLAGAAALVATPFVDTQLWETVERVLSSDTGPVSPAILSTRGRKRDQNGIIVALYGPKSGSGTSVIAANLAVTLQERAARGAVLIEVGEGTGSQAVLLNLRAERTLGDLLARFDPEDTEFLSEVLATHESGLRVLLAPPSQGLRIPPDLLEEILDLLQKMFDFVVIDLHAAAKTNSIATMRKAHAALVLIVPEMTSLHSGQLFVETMTATLPEVGLNIILNRSTLPAGVPAEAIRKHLKMKIAHEMPDDQALVTASVNRGVPFVISHWRSAAARAIQKLADDLTPAATADKSGGLASLVKGSGPLAKLIGRGR